MAGKFDLKDILNQRSKETDMQEKEYKTDGVVELVDIYDMIPSQDNFYSTDAIMDLVNSIKLVGILQPLLLSESEEADKFGIKAGHRRREALLYLVEKEGLEQYRYAPAIIKQEQDDVIGKLTIIMANRFREKSDWEKMQEAIQTEELLAELKGNRNLNKNTREQLKEMLGIDGDKNLKTRDFVAQILGTSQAQVGRYKAIYNNLCGELMHVFKEKLINVSVAAELAGLSLDSQGDAYEMLRDKGSLATKESVEEFVAAYEDAQKASESSLNSQAKLFENIKIESDKTVKDMIEGLDSQVAAFNQYKDELLFASSLVAAGLLDSGLLGAIEELGISGAGYLHELVLAANTDTDEYNRLMLSWAEMQDAKTQLADTTTYIKLSQSEFMNDLITMQHTKNSEMSDEVESTSEETIQSVEELMNSLVAITDDGIGDVTKTVKTKAPEVEKTSEELCSGAIDGANEILQVSEDGTSLSFVSIGYSIPQGVAQGIMDGQQLVSDALQYVIDNAIDSIDLSGITAKINRELGDLY